MADGVPQDLAQLLAAMLAVAVALGVVGLARLAQALRAWRAWQADRCGIERLLLAALPPQVGRGPPRAGGSIGASGGRRIALAMAAQS